MCGKWFWLATYAVVAAAAAAQQEVRDFGGFFLYFKAKGAEPKHYLNVSKSIIWLWLFGAVAAAAALIVFVVCYKRDSRFWFDNDVYQALYFLAHPPPPSTHTHSYSYTYTRMLRSFLNDVPRREYICIQTFVHVYCEWMLFFLFWGSTCLSPSLCMLILVFWLRKTEKRASIDRAIYTNIYRRRKFCVFRSHVKRQNSTAYHVMRYAHCNFIFLYIHDEMHNHLQISFKQCTFKAHTHTPS